MHAPLALAALALFAPGSVSFDGTLAVRRDDNILQLSARDLERLSGNPAPGRFLITTPDDTITIAHAGVRWRGRAFGGMKATLGAGADLYRYRTNRVKDHEHFALTAALEFPHARRAGTELRFRVEHTPDEYLRQLTDDDASFAAGRRIRAAARYADTEIAAGLQHEWARGRVVVTLEHEWRRRDYNTAFDERDAHDRTWELGVRVRPLRRWAAALSCTVRRGTLAARGDLPYTLIPDHDVSYRHREVELALALPWRVAGGGRIEFSAARERREFSTADIYDVLRFGREDDRRDDGVRVVQSVGKAFDLALDWHRLSNNARFPDGVDGGDDITDFTQVRWTLGLRWRP